MVLRGTDMKRQEDRRSQDDVVRDMIRSYEKCLRVKDKWELNKQDGFASRIIYSEVLNLWNSLWAWTSNTDRRPTDARQFAQMKDKLHLLAELGDFLRWFDLELEQLKDEGVQVTFDTGSINKPNCYYALEAYVELHDLRKPVFKPTVQVNQGRDFEEEPSAEEAFQEEVISDEEIIPEAVPETAKDAMAMDELARYGWDRLNVSPNGRLHPQDNTMAFAVDAHNPEGFSVVAVQDSIETGDGHFAELVVTEVDDSVISAPGALSFGWTKMGRDAQMTGNLCDLEESFFVGGPFRGEFDPSETNPKASSYCHGIYQKNKTLKFASARATQVDELCRRWQVGDTLSIWIRKRDKYVGEFLFSFFINHNRVFTCNCLLDNVNQDFRIVASGHGRVRGFQLVTDARPPARLGLNYWYSPERKGAQKIIENIVFVDETCQNKRPLRVDWDMAMSPCNVSHTQTYKNKALHFSPKPLERSLNRLGYLDQVLSAKVSKLMLIYMGDNEEYLAVDGVEAGPQNSDQEVRAAVSQIIATYFLKRVFLRDEVLLILIKQLTKNPNTLSTCFGLVLLKQLIEISTEEGERRSHIRYHLPMLLKSFLENFCQEKTDESKALAEDCLQTFHYVKNLQAELYKCDERLEVYMQTHIVSPAPPPKVKGPALVMGPNGKPVLGPNGHPMAIGPDGKPMVMAPGPNGKLVAVPGAKAPKMKAVPKAQVAAQKAPSSSPKTSSPKPKARK